MKKFEIGKKYFAHNDKNYTIEILDRNEREITYIQSDGKINSSPIYNDEGEYFICNQRVYSAYRISRKPDNIKHLNDYRIGSHIYMPEFAERKPDCKMEADLLGNGYYSIESEFEIKGRGITFSKQYKVLDLSQHNQYKAGWFSYIVTKKAYEKLRMQYPIARKMYNN